MELILKLGQVQGGQTKADQVPRSKEYKEEVVEVELKKKTVAQLREMCRSAGLKNYTRLRKNKIIEALMETRKV